MSLFGSGAFGAGPFGLGSPPFSASGVTFTIEIAFTTDPLGVPGTWTDVTDYTRRLSTRRGRNHELGKTAAGVATVVLDNRDRRFDPTYTSSPYYPNVVPMRQIRITATYALVPYPIFYGYVEDWGQTWPAPAANAQGDAYIELQAVDAFKVFNMLDLTSYPEAVGADSPVAYYRLAEGEAGAAVAEGSDDLDGTYEGTVVFEAGNLVGQGTVPDFTAGYVRLPDVSAFDDLVDKSMTLECWIRPESVAGTTRIVFGDDVFFLIQLSGTGLRFGYDSQNVTDTPTVTATSVLAVNTWYHVAAVRDWPTGTQTIYVNGVQVAATNFGRFPTGTSRSDYTVSGSSFPFPGRIAHVAVYGTALSPFRIAAHYAAGIDTLEADTSGAAVTAVLDAIGWPAGLRDIDTGVSTVNIDPTGSALNTMQDVAEDTEHGILVMSPTNKVTFIDRAALFTGLTALATFGDSTGETPYADLVFSYDDQDLWTEVTASSDAGSVTASDAAAAARYGRRVLDTSGSHASLNEVADVATGLLARYKAPAMRPTTLTVNKSGTQQLSRAIGDRVTIKRRPPGGGTITVDALIEGIDHDAGPDGFLTTTFALVPVESVTPWLLADTTYGVLDSTTRLGW